MHFDDREVADPPLQGIWIFYCMYQSITLNSEKISVMKQLSSKRVRVELENKHSGFSPALCKDSLFEHEMYDYYMWEDAKHFLFDVNTVIMLCALLYSSVYDNTL